MGWREVFLTHFGPGLLGGITFGDWLRLLREERFAIAPSCLPRAVSITLQSFRNSILRSYEYRRFGPRLRHVAVQPPLFVLGHWRNGTTHLHNLLCADRRFAFPNNYQVFFPHTFLSTEGSGSRLLSFFFPRRRPMDNMQWNLQSPQEDEFALCASTLKSPCMGWIFPRRRGRFEKYLTWRGVADSEIAEWQAAFELFLTKLTFKYGRPLILKSPPHTCRIGLLLRIFPDARFVHIHRNPYVVFQSSKRMFQVNGNWHCLQRPRADDLDDWVIRQYREMTEGAAQQPGGLRQDPK